MKLMIPWGSQTINKEIDKKKIIISASDTNGIKSRKQG